MILRVTEKWFCKLCGLSYIEMSTNSLGLNTHLHVPQGFHKGKVLHCIRIMNSELVPSFAPDLEINQSFIHFLHQGLLG